jgi:tetratricopeptide (TPR) repeat protein
VGQGSLIGREDELERLDLALRAAEEGEPAVVLVFGEAGVGKTTLVAEARRRAAERGFTTAAGGCADGSTDLPLAPLRSILLGLEQQLGDRLRNLVTTRPDLAGLVPGVAAPSTDEPDAGRLYADLLAVLGELSATTPVLLVLEDLHWADRSTVELLAFVVRNLGAERLALLITVRTEDLDLTSWSGKVLEELHRLPSVERLAVGGLGRADVASLAAAALGAAPSPTIVDQLFDRTAGNPFLTTELVASGDLDAGRLPDSLRGVLDLRLGRLAPSTARLVRVAAALEAPIDTDALVAVLAEEELDVEQELRAAIDVGVLHLQDGEPDFRHALLREAAYDQLLGSERRRIHAAAATAATERGASAAVVAHHAERAGLTAEALVSWLAAAREATTGFARVDAPPAYMRALDLWPEVADAEQRTGTTRRTLLREAADASLAVGETDHGAGFAEQALAATDPADETEAWVDLALTLSELRWEQGRMGDADVLLGQIDGRLDAEVPSSHLAWLRERQSFHAIVRGEEDDALRLGREAVDIAIAVDDVGVELYSLAGLGFAHALAGDVTTSLELLLDARARSDEADMARPAVRATINLLVVLTALGDAPRAAEEGERALAMLARFSEALPNHGTIYALLARALIEVGDLTRADEVLREAPPVAGRLFQAYLAVARADLALARGRLDDATRALDGLAVELEANPYWAVQLSVVQAELELARGEPEAARHSAERLVELAEIWADSSALRLRATAVAAARLTEPELVVVHLGEARRRYGELVATVEPLDATGWMAQVEALAADDPDDAEAHWRLAAERFSAAGHHMRAVAALAQAEPEPPAPTASSSASAIADVSSPAPPPGGGPGLFRFGDIDVDVDQFRIRRGGAPVHVEPQVLEVLAHLIANRDRVVTKDELFEEVWGGPFVGEAALTSRIRDARKAVGDDGKRQHVIRTVHGRGYQFIAELSDR